MKSNNSSYVSFVGVLFLIAGTLLYLGPFLVSERKILGKVVTEETTGFDWVASGDAWSVVALVLVVLLVLVGIVAVVMAQLGASKKKKGDGSVLAYGAKQLAKKGAVAKFVFVVVLFIIGALPLIANFIGISAIADQVASGVAMTGWLSNFVSSAVSMGWACIVSGILIACGFALSMGGVLLGKK
ncbi:MAG: hypothetical protein J6Y65_04165 [Eggerthellaceae bacterium]|nr:hypothetical protein [Eggerthellaceae bacterium]